MANPATLTISPAKFVKGKVPYPNKKGQETATKQSKPRTLEGSVLALLFGDSLKKLFIPTLDPTELPFRLIQNRVG
ncbi:MAG: hypothetical protein V4646_19215 [Pseudomonadota bacterium]